MKAFQIISPLHTVLKEIDAPACRAGEVLLRIRYVGFCGSDLNTYLGRNPMVRMPVIPGHEVGATIEAVGTDVPDFLRPGQHVTVDVRQASIPEILDIALKGKPIDYEIAGKQIVLKKAVERFQTDQHMGLGIPVSLVCHCPVHEISLLCLFHHLVYGKITVRFQCRL